MVIVYVDSNVLYFIIILRIQNISFSNFEKNTNMQEASFNGFLKIVIYMIGFYYLIKFLSRIFLPIILNKVVQKAQENFTQKHGQFNQNQEVNQDFKTTNKTNPKPTKKVGEYIDYEELN